MICAHRTFTFLKQSSKWLAGSKCVGAAWVTSRAGV